MRYVFLENPFDVRTIDPLLKQMKDNKLPIPDELACDRGSKDKSEIEGVKILIPLPPKKRDTDYQKQTKRKKHRTRAAIEPIIEHLKSDFRMAQNCLWGAKGIQINALMAATAWNFRKYIEISKEKILHFIFRSLLIHSKFLFRIRLDEEVLRID